MHPIFLSLINNQQYSGIFGGALYIKVVPSKNPDCSWESYSQSDNCNFLKEAVNAVWKGGRYRGQWVPYIFSTANIWKKYFGSTCDTFAKDTGAYLSYAIYDSTGHVVSTQTKHDFVPFGGWAAGDWHIIAKQVGGSVRVPLLCGHKAWHALVDEVYLGP